MANDHNALEEWAGVLLQKMEPAARSKLTRSLAQKLRRSQQQRVKQQRNPLDFKGKKGRIKRQAKMFQKLPRASHLKAKGDGQSITVGFTGRVARIARVHQYGLKDRAEVNVPEVRYKRRETLGFTGTDLEMIRDSLLSHLAQ